MKETDSSRERKTAGRADDDIFFSVEEISSQSDDAMFSVWIFNLLFLFLPDFGRLQWGPHKLRQFCAYYFDFAHVLTHARSAIFEKFSINTENPIEALPIAPISSYFSMYAETGVSAYVDPTIADYPRLRPRLTISSAVACARCALSYTLPNPLFTPSYELSAGAILRFGAKD